MPADAADGTVPDPRPWRKVARMTDAVVELDPALSEGLTDAHRLAAEVHVLRARADSLRGPRKGERALMLALRASEREQELLGAAGLDTGAALLREMAEHP